MTDRSVTPWDMSRIPSPPSTEFLATIEKDLAVEAGGGTSADLQKFILKLLQSDQEFLVVKLTAVFPDRAGSTFLNNELVAGRVAVKNQYNKFALKIFGALVEA